MTYRPIRSIIIVEKSSTNQQFSILTNLLLTKVTVKIKLQELNRNKICLLMTQWNCSDFNNTFSIAFVSIWQERHARIGMGLTWQSRQSLWNTVTRDCDNAVVAETKTQRCHLVTGTGNVDSHACYGRYNVTMMDDTYHCCWLGVHCSTWESWAAYVCVVCRRRWPWPWLWVRLPNPELQAAQLVSADRRRPLSSSDCSPRSPLLQKNQKLFICLQRAGGGLHSRSLVPKV